MAPRGHTLSPAKSPPGTECFDIFSPPPGDSEVISQLERLNSNETKIAPRLVWIAVNGSDLSAPTFMVGSKMDGSDPHFDPESIATHNTSWDLETSELAAAGGYNNGLFYNFAAPDFTVLGGKVLFAGQDATGNPNLWVTDGTSAGTKELAVAGANSGGLFSLNFFPSGFSPGFTGLGARALFEGYDASGIDGLWVTDGTSAGTGELTVAGSLANGLFFDVNTPDLTVLAGKAVFAGEDASGDISLWTTDATGAATSELTVAGSYAKGLFFNVTATDFTVLGNKV